MTKSEILQALTASGEISTFKRTPNWDKAFEKHNLETGKHKHQSCGSCYRDVLAWLKS